MDPPDRSDSNRESRPFGSSQSPKGKGREKENADEQLNTSASPLPSNEGASDDSSDEIIAYPFPSPPPSTTTMWFIPQGTFLSEGTDVSTDAPTSIAPSRPSSDLGYTTMGGPTFRGRQNTQTPDSSSCSKRTSATGSINTVIGPDNQYTWQTLADIEREHMRQRRALIKRVAPERREALVEVVSQEQPSPRPSLEQQPPDNDSEITNVPDPGQVFSRKSSPSRAISPLPHRPRTAEDLKSESNRRQSRFLDHYASGSRRGKR